jgi:hypothetical protein
MGEKRNAYKILFGKPEGQAPLESGRNGWESNITVDFNEVGRGVVDCICLAQDTW